MRAVPRIRREDGGDVILVLDKFQIGLSLPGEFAAKMTPSLVVFSARVEVNRADYVRLELCGKHYKPMHGFQ